MNDRVLIVDDDPNLLRALARQYRKRFDLDVAEGPEKALGLLDGGKEYAVVVSDMRMPGMDGIALLGRFRDRTPDTSRIMLTGNADQETAVKAINEGAIFRFFSKPCDTEVLASGIEAAIEHHRLVTAEKELLEKTLAGSLKFVIDILSHTAPQAFVRVGRVREWARKVARESRLAQAWQLDIATMMLPMVEFVLPPSVVEHMREGRKLSPDERKAVSMAPLTTRRLLSNIPRLAPVGDIIVHAFPDAVVAARGIGEHVPEVPPRAAKILHVLWDLAAATTGPVPESAALDKVMQLGAAYDPQALEDVRRVICAAPPESRSASDGGESVEPEVKIFEVAIRSLTPGLVLESDLRLADGSLVLSAGNLLSKAQVHRIQSQADRIKFQEPVRVHRQATGSVLDDVS
jgi:ActR/RegA family two-component response regulator